MSVNEATNTIQKAVDALKSTRLWQYLNLLDEDYGQRAVRYVSQITPLLETIVQHFPYYTRHDAHHSYKVMNRITDIGLPDCLIKGKEVAFSKTEALILIMAAYGHDLGMTVLPDEEDEFRKRFSLSDDHNWKQHEKLTAELRKTHSTRGGVYLGRHAEQFGIPAALTRQLNTLMESHNYSGIELSKISRTMAANEGIFDLLQLAAIFCTADLLEYSETRIVHGVIEKLQEELKKSPDDALLRSLYENTKHDNIQGNVAIADDGKVIIGGAFQEADVLNIAYKAADEIESWLHIYYDIDCTAKKRRMRLRDTVQVDFGMIGKDFHRLGIRIKKENVIGLISSNSVWLQKPEMVIRELLQNSLEACRYRAFTSGEKHDYNPKITVIFDTTQRTCTIADNGCGMSRNVILNHFLTVGNSRANEPDYQSKNYASLARFGIGFWSVFTIAQNAAVQTASFDPSNAEPMTTGVSFDVNISYFKDYTVFEPKILPIGTTITLQLKPEINITELVSNLQGQFGVIHCAQIPIEIVYGNTTIAIPNEPMLPGRMEIFGPKIEYANQQDVRIFKDEVKKGDIIYKAQIVYRIINGKISFLSDSDNLSSLTSAVHSFAITSVYGFPVFIRPKLDLHAIIGGDVFGYIINTNNPKGFIYNINRQVLIDSPASQEMSIELTQLLMETYRKFLTQNGAYTPKEISRLYDESSLRYTHGDGRSGSSSLDSILHYAPDLFCFKLIDITDRNAVVFPTTIEYISIQELLARDITVISLKHSIHINPAGRVFRMETLDQELDFVRIIPDLPEKCYYMEGAANVIFDNQPSGKVHVAKFQWEDSLIYVTVFIAGTKNLQIPSERIGHICDIRGKWSGSISEREVTGGMFAFAGNNRLLLQKGSVLATKIKALAAEGNTIEISRIVNLLSASWGGFMNDEVKEYLI